jgi:hypothetical protein
MKLTAMLLTAAMMTAMPAYAGGPVLTLEETYEAAPAERDNSWIVPVVIGLLILGAVTSGGGDDAPADPGPQPCKLNGGGGC